jgi:cytidylate kinase
MIITITGYPGSGKSTLGKGIAKALGLKHYSAGDFLREIAKERGMSLLQILHAMEKDRSIDDEIDRRSELLGKKEGNFVIDGRMAWHFIPNSTKIFVKIDLKAAAKRIYEDTCAGKKERCGEGENKSLEETEKNMRERLELNRNAYKRLYKVDYLDEKNYDIVIDTTQSGIEETRETALKKIREIEKAF